MVSCGGSTATTGVTYNGAEFKAAWYTTDFALMRLDVSPLGDSRLSRLGWDRSSNTPSLGTGIHHPSGDVMKISFENNTFQTSSWNGTNNHWLLFFDDGVVEHGSSGSPILNQDDRVVGQLHGNQNYNPSLSYCDQNRAEYGRFDLSWTGGGTDATRLSTWLDPDNLGTYTSNTKRNPIISGPSILCSSGGSYSISNVPSGASITWSSSTGIARTSAQGSNPCNFIATNSGTTGWVSATITYNGNNISLPQKTMWLGGVPSPELYANNATLTGSDWYTVVLNTPDVYFCLVPDPAGSPIYPDTWEVEGDSYWYTNGSFLEFVPNVLGENIVAGYRHNTCGFNGTYFTIEVVSSKSGEVVEDIYFKLSPNPANEYVDIKLALPDEEKMVDSYRVDFVDSYSRNVKQVVLSGPENRVNIQDLHPGYYVVLLRYNGEVYSNKLILE